MRHISNISIALWRADIKQLPTEVLKYIEANGLFHLTFPDNASASSHLVICRPSSKQQERMLVRPWDYIEQSLPQALEHEPCPIPLGAFSAKRKSCTSECEIRDRLQRI
jgi:hypothetical protein